MPRVTSSRSDMVRTMARLLRRQGYSATGWRQVVAESGAPWGSQAHHFPGGKQQLAAEAVAASGSSYERMLRAALEGSGPSEAIRAWAELAADHLESTNWLEGCPIATVALEQGAVSEPVGGACGRVLKSWQAVITSSLEEHGLGTEQAGNLATLVLAGIEGALLLSKALQDHAPLTTVGVELASVIAARIEEARSPSS